MFKKGQSVDSAMREFAARTHGKHAPRHVPDVSDTLIDLYRKWGGKDGTWQHRPGRHRTSA